MRTVLFIALCVAVMAGVGIIRFRKSGDNVNVTIDTGELREKTEELIDVVTETLSDEESEDSTRERFEEWMEDADNAVDAAEEAATDFIDHGYRRRP
jgi:hypothetical protein